MNYLTCCLLCLCSVQNVYSQKVEDQDHLIYSIAMGEERMVKVHLPADYSRTSETYGVLYVLDGEYTFDYAVGAVSFLSNAFGHLPPLIVVGVPNIDRTRDMAVNYGSSLAYKKFMNFIENELIPFVAKTYRTNGFDLLYGWSSASNISMQFLATNPDLFNAHIQTGTGIGKKTTTFFSNNLPENIYQNVYLYVNVEGEGPRLTGFRAYENLIATLKPNGLMTKFEPIESSSHVHVMADGIYRGLQFVFSSFYIPDTVTIQGAREIIDYYLELSDSYGYDVQIPVGAINESAGILFQKEKPDESIKLLEYGMNSYPQSYHLDGSLGEIYEYLGNRGQAAIYYEQAFKKAPKGSSDAMKYRYLSQKMKTIKK